MKPLVASMERYVRSKADEHSGTVSAGIGPVIVMWIVSENRFDYFERDFKRITRIDAKRLLRGYRRKECGVIGNVRAGAV